MSLSAFDVSAFSLGGNDFLARLKMFKISGDGDVVDGAGLADIDEVNVMVKQAHKFDFTTYLLSGGVKATNLNISLWKIGGTDWLADVRSGAINVTRKTKEGSSIASGYKKPGGMNRSVEVTTTKLVTTSPELANKVFVGTASDMQVAVQIEFAGLSFQMPMLLRAGSVGFERGDYIMEDVTLVGRGPATSPSSGSGLLGKCLLGDGVISVGIQTAAGTWGNAEGNAGLITRLNTQLNDGALIEQTGTIEMQGAMDYAAPGGGS